MGNSEEISCTASNGNVFADLGFAQSEEMLLKTELARRISAIIEGRHLTQVEAASRLGIDQPKVSNLMRGRLSGFSVERLLHFLTALGSDVEIVVKPKPPGEAHGRIWVNAA